jgi:hypothetical protein
MTVSIQHSLEFVTELDETNPTARRLLALSHEGQVELLESMLKSLVAPQLQPILDELNAGNTYATLKVVM